jgi:hypothetical protein
MLEFMQGCKKSGFCLNILVNKSGFIREPGFLGASQFCRGSRMATDNLLVITRDLLPSGFAPTNIFAKLRCTQFFGVAY